MVSTRRHVLCVGDGDPCLARCHHRVGGVAPAHNAMVARHAAGVVGARRHALEDNMWWGYISRAKRRRVTEAEDGAIGCQPAHVARPGMCVDEEGG